jgi:hypothetical protein
MEFDLEKFEVHWGDYVRDALHNAGDPTDDACIRSLALDTYKDLITELPGKRIYRSIFGDMNTRDHGRHWTTDVEVAKQWSSSSGQTYDPRFKRQRGNKHILTATLPTSLNNIVDFEATVANRLAASEAEVTLLPHVTLPVELLDESISNLIHWLTES